MSTPSISQIQQPPSLTEMVAAKIRDAIMDGEIGFSENISEERLAVQFGVSRTPVRDALSALQFTGLVRVLPKRGSFVFSPSIEEIRALGDYRVILEREALKLAIAENSADLLAALDDAVVQMRGAVSGGNLKAYARADTAFHRAFFDHCGNLHMRAAHNLCEAQIAAIRHALSLPEPGRVEASLEEHSQIVALLTVGDLDGVRKQLRTHIQTMRSIASERLKAQG